MSREDSGYQTLIKLSFEALKSSFISAIGESISHPFIVSKNTEELPLFSKAFSVQGFFSKMADKVYMNKAFKNHLDLGEASDTSKLLYYILQFDSAISKRKTELANIEIRTQLDLYSKIVHSDDTLLAMLHIINWLEEIYEIPEPIIDNIVNFANTAKIQAKKPKEGKISLDIDSIATATDADMDPKERHEFKDLMRKVYYFIRKGLISSAENFLVKSSQVIPSIKVNSI